MTITRQQEIIDWAITKLEDYQKEKKLYNTSAILLSILDIVCGIITIFYSGMLITSVVASILCGTAWGARFVQLIKVEKFAKSLKLLSGASLTYIAIRKKRSEFMKNIKITNWIVGIVTVLGFSSVALCYFIPALAEYIEYAVYALCAILPADLVAIFNNAKISAEEIQEKVDIKKLKQAEIEAKKELEAKQKAELEILTKQKLEQSNANVDTSIKG